MTKFKLGTQVVVSDPCYTIPTWCQIIVDNVLPGYYEPHVKKSDLGDWGNRIGALLAIHEDYIGKEDELNLTWVDHAGEVGVDSGQAGIFSRETYRNDNIVDSIPKAELKEEFRLFGGRVEEGDKWYERISTHTLSDKSWGMYYEGVVSSSGIGDGGYDLYVLTTEDGVVVGFCIDYLIDDEGFMFDFYMDPLIVTEQK
jgi:hypothetical protein